MNTYWTSSGICVCLRLACDTLISCTFYLTANKINYTVWIKVFWVLTSYTFVGGYQCAGETYGLFHQGRSVKYR
jgi:hypothetical protein